MGMKTTHVEFVQGNGEANGNEDYTHADFVQGDVSGKEGYSR